MVLENVEIEFKNIESELYRVYVFPDGSEVKIENPVGINVSKSGGHRVLGDNGLSHYIPSGWIHLYWKPKTGQPAFVF